MGMYDDAKEFLKFAVLLKDEVSRTTSNLSRVGEKLENLQMRVLKLETREEGNAGRSEAAAQAAAAIIIQRELGDVRERLAKVELFLRGGTIIEGTQKRLQSADKGDK